ncbi:MAG: hypothetical protein HY812_08310 [Planctomycetes bacterium]|nr:hypothetical protein [Planctomycetota bacterium]
MENEKIRISSCGSLLFDLPDDLVEGVSIESVLLRAGGAERPLAPTRAGGRDYVVERVPHGRHEIVLRVSAGGALSLTLGARKPWQDGGPEGKSDRQVEICHIAHGASRFSATMRGCVRGSQ